MTRQQIILLPEQPDHTEVRQQVWWQHPGHSFSRILERLNNALAARCPEGEAPETQTVLPEHRNYWKRLTQISNAKREFSKDFLVQWPYNGFEPKDRSDEASTYVFNLSPLDPVISQNLERMAQLKADQDEDEPEAEKSLEILRKEYTEKLSAGTPVEIPLEEGDSGMDKLIGTVVELECPENLQGMFRLTLEFKDKAHLSAKDLSQRGIIKERPSSDYKNYELALDAMTNLTELRQWQAAERIIIEEKTEPFPCTDEPTFTSANLTENQKQAVRMALNTPDFLLVQGPPGTGKTTIITEMIRNFVDRGQRVLVCSKNNLAVDNVLEKWIKENRGRADGHLCVRLGNESRIKLDLLKDYTPAQVTVRMQEKIFDKSRSERDWLIAQIEEPLRQVQISKQVFSQGLELCLYSQELLLALEALSKTYQNVLRFPRFLTKLGIRMEVSQVLAKQQTLERIRSMLYFGVFKPLTQILCSQTAPAGNRVEQLRSAYARAARLIPNALGQCQCSGIAGWLYDANKQKLAQQENRLRQLIMDYGRFYGIFPQLAEFPGNRLREHPEYAAGVAQISKALEENRHPVVITKQLQESVRQMQRICDQDSIRLSRLRAVLNDWLTELGKSKSNSLEQLLICNAVPVTGSTCMGIMSDDDFKETAFDVVIVDEAGQIPIFDILVPIIKAKKVILIGDHLQLPPMNEQDFAHHYAQQQEGEDRTTEGYKTCRRQVEELYNVSLFEKLYNAKDLDAAKIMIRQQFRMHPDISRFVSDNFYGGKYETGISRNGRAIRIAGKDQPIYFYDTCNLPNRFETDHQPGYSNEVEAELCARILVDLITDIRSGNYTIRQGAALEKNGTYDIGVISGYSLQVQLIKEKTRKKLMALMSEEEADKELDKFMISSVDSFQGRDNEIILFSMTRSNKEGKIGFLRDVRRLNVAMTRAKSMLIMVGDSSTLLGCKKPCQHDKNLLAATVYRNLVDYCTKNGYYHPVKGGDENGLS